MITEKKYKQLKYNLEEWHLRHQLSLSYKMYARNAIEQYELSRKLSTRIKRFFRLDN